MSTDEKMATIGRVVTNACESKKRVSILKSDLEAMSNGLEGAARLINRVIQGTDYTESDLREATQKIPSPEKVRAACADFLAELKRSEELKARVVGLGI